jgi:hypothetical protein
MSGGNRSFLDPRTAATNKQREIFEAAVKAEQGQLNRKLTGRERSVLWAKFAPSSTSLKRPSRSDRKPRCSAITFQTALWRSFKWLHGK